jgi:hypothetical protein
MLLLKQLFRWALFIAAQLVLFVVLLELGLRITGIYTTYLEANTGGYLSNYRNYSADSLLHVSHPNRSFNKTTEDFNFIHQINNEGIRDWEHPLLKDSCEYRIVTLGDSFTEGVGAPADSSWPKLMEVLLNQNLLSPPNISVIQGGVGGSDPFCSYKLYEQRLEKYGPDLVIMAVNTTDEEDYSIRGGLERYVDGKCVYREPPINESVYRRFHLFRFYTHFIRGMDGLFINKNKKKTIRSQFEVDLLNLILEFDASLKMRGISFVVVVHPLSGELTNNYGKSMSWLLDALDSQKVKHIDIREYFVRNHVADNLTKYYWPTDYHNTPTGYLSFATAIHARILGLGDSLTLSLPCQAN